MHIIGLTGGIGSGKSTIADFFSAYVDVIDADEIARQVVRPESSALKTIAHHFGKNAISLDGTLNRVWLRHKIFSDLSEKTWLENLLHPLIRTEIVSALKKSRSPYCMLMSPLLLETDQHLLVDRILVVDVPKIIQITRTTKRDNSSEESIKAIIDTQFSRSDRLAKADDIIINTADIALLKKTVSQLHQTYSMLAKP